MRKLLRRWLLGDIPEIEELKTRVDKKRREHKKGLTKYRSYEEKIFGILHEVQSIDPEFENLFHRLNYQRVVDETSKRITRWKFILIGFSLATILVLYFWSTYLDAIVPANSSGSVLSDYERLISAVDLEVNWDKEGKAIFPREYESPHPRYGKIDSTFAELSITSVNKRKTPDVQTLAATTNTFWNVYFARYLLVRTFIAAVLLILINSGVKIYKRLRRDRMSLTYREEATTTILYFIEKYMTTKKSVTKTVVSDGKEIQQTSEQSVVTEKDKERIVKLIPQIAAELYHNPDSSNRVGEDLGLVSKVLSLAQQLTPGVPKKNDNSDNAESKGEKGG